MKIEQDFEIVHAATSRGIQHRDCGEMLSRIARVMDGDRVPFFLAFGTLLGAHRDRAFIHSDTDIDLGLLKSDQDAFSRLVKEKKFQAWDLHVCRISEWLISLAYREKIYADFYFFTLNGNRYEAGPYWISREQLYGPQKGRIKFMGRTFWCPWPIEDYLQDRYGADWRVPQVEKHAQK